MNAEQVVNGGRLCESAPLFGANPVQAMGRFVAHAFRLRGRASRSGRVRRLHDSNLSGWWAWMAVVPPLAIVLMLLGLRRSRFEGARFD